jgi:tetraacyldisaccharide 4'-kinase
MNDILKRYQRMDSRNKIVVTTEKDATRLEAFSDFFFSNGIPVFVLPVQVVFCDNDEEVFQHDIRTILEDFKV